MTMQYTIRQETSLAGPKTYRTWEVVATDKDGGYLGRICKFNTEQQARDYIAVQEGIKVSISRSLANRRDFWVFINGEHRADFRRRSYSTGYDLQGADGSDIRGARLGSTITQADFELVVRSAIAAGEMPTLAQIERSQLIDQAWKDNRAWDEAKSNHAARVRREVLEVALENYLGQPFGSDEHKAKAQQMLDGLKSGSAWL